MPVVKSRRRSDKRLALNKHIVQIQTEIAKLKRERASVNRDEFVEVTKSVQQLKKNTDDLIEHTKNLATQLTRIAQIQVEVDAIKRALAKAKLLD
jgi:hypothetical protein